MNTASSKIKPVFSILPYQNNPEIIPYTVYKTPSQTPSHIKAPGRPCLAPGKGSRSWPEVAGGEEQTAALPGPLCRQLRHGLSP